MAHEDAPKADYYSLLGMPMQDRNAWGVLGAKRIYQLSQGNPIGVTYNLGHRYAERDMELFRSELIMAGMINHDVVEGSVDRLEIYFNEMLKRHLVLGGIGIVSHQDYGTPPKHWPFYLGKLHIGDEVVDIKETATAYYDEDRSDSSYLEPLSYTVPIHPTGPLPTRTAKALLAFSTWPEGIAVERSAKHSFDIFNTSSPPHPLTDSDQILYGGGSHWSGSIWWGVRSFLQLARELDPEYQMKGNVAYYTDYMGSKELQWGWDSGKFVGALQPLNQTEDHI